MIEKSLRKWLRPVVNRQKRLFVMKKLALYWFLVAIAGIAMILADNLWGLSSSIELGLLLIAAALITIIALIKSSSIEPDYKQIARNIEMHNPELKATLLTAIEQRPRDLSGQLDYLQERVVGEALAHARKHNWIESIPQSKFILTGIANAAVLIFFIVILANLPAPANSQSQDDSGFFSTPKAKGYELTVTPGDTTVEKGTTLVILARFDGKVPDNAKLYAGLTPEDKQEILFSKNLEDPVFGGMLSQISSDMLYHIEYDDNKTQDYIITTYEYPSLERADANIVYPAYTNLPGKEIKDTRRFSVVEGSKVTLTFTLNKEVDTAQLISKEDTALNLTVNPDEPTVLTTVIEPIENQRYELKLVDSDGRANKAPPRFVIDVHKNMPPDLKLKFPNRDIEASPLEEITLEAEVSDDYGVTSHGFSYILAGSQAEDVNIGDSVVPANKKQPIEYVLTMEDLNVEPDQLLTYFFWAEDIGPDGNARRTVSDLYFTEVRSFEQIFRENESFMDQNQQERQQQQEQQEGEQNEQQQREELIQIQKQIISATWNIKREADLSKDIEQHKDDIDFVKESQTEAIEMALSGGQQGGGSMMPMGMEPEQGGQRGQRGQGGQGGQRGQRGQGGQRGQRGSGGMNQMRSNPPAPINNNSADPMEEAVKHMENAVEHLEQTLESSTPEELLQALGSEQAAYQELLKLREDENEVARDRSNQQQNMNQSARSQQQLQQLEMRQREDRYETQSEAQSQQQDSQQREDLQVLNRLRELARRQNEMTERLREAEAALREAQNEQEREQIQRELERLREEQVENLRDVDELQQRMENEQNRQRMSESAEQLSQTRERMQQSAEQMQQGQVSQAAANSTRAQRELEEMRDEFQRSTSGQFTQQMQDMRQQARELDERQQQISEQMNQQTDAEDNPLGQDGINQKLAEAVEEQRERIESLMEQMRELSEQSEESEPLLSRRLYDTYRQTSQENLDRTLENMEELLRRNFVPQAQDIDEQAREGIQNLREGIEEAAESILGDEADSLRLARQQLDELIRQLDQEAARAGEQGDPNQAGQMTAQSGQRGQQGSDPNQAGQMTAQGGEGERGQRGFDPNQAGQMTAQGEGERGQRGFDPNQAGQMTAQDGQRGQRGSNTNQTGDMMARGGNRSGQGLDPNELAELVQNMPGGQGLDPNQLAEMIRRSMEAEEGLDPNEIAELVRNMQGGQYLDPNQIAEMIRQGMQRDDRFNPNGPGTFQPLNFFTGFDPNFAPLTGDDFRQWSDALREVEEMLSEQELREEVATARERATEIREDFTRLSKEPQWDTVQMEIVKPLTEVRERISEELAKIDSKEEIVPIDRDPVPSRYAELVRIYYENLGGDN